MDLRVVFTALLTICASAPSVAQPLQACAANLEYPPYVFSKRRSVVSAKEVTGISIDVLNTALENLGEPPAHVERFPWVRCLKLVELGKFDIILNVPTAQIDPAPYFISEPYAELHTEYFVSRLRWPRGIAIHNLQDLRSFRVCGLLGNRYDSYGLRSGWVDTGTNNYVSLIKKLHAGHCDLFMEKSEVIAGLVAEDAELRGLLSSSIIIRTRLPEDSPIGLHYAISRRKENSKRLLRELNRTIRQLRLSGELENLRKSYMAGHANTSRQ